MLHSLQISEIPVGTRELCLLVSEIECTPQMWVPEVGNIYHWFGNTDCTNVHMFCTTSSDFLSVFVTKLNYRSCMSQMFSSWTSIFTFHQILFDDWSGTNFQEHEPVLVLCTVMCWSGVPQFTSNTCSHVLWCVKCFESECVCQAQLWCWIWLGVMELFVITPDQRCKNCLRAKSMPSSRVPERRKLVIAEGSHCLPEWSISCGSSHM